MSGTTSNIVLSHNWKTIPGAVGLSAIQILKPASMKYVRIVMIQADKDNLGCIAFGDSTGVTMLVDYGAKLTANANVTLPLNLETSMQELHLIADRAGQKFSISYFDGGAVC